MELARNFNHRGLVDWSLDRPLAAEPSFRQAWEIWTELADRFPQEPAYQSGLAGMLANLGSVCYFSDRFDEAEEYYRRAEAIAEHLPVELKNSAEGLASQAGSLTNQAELARLRGQYDRALELLEASIPLHKQSLEKWPTNPVALDCYFHTHWNIGECHLGAGRADAAAAAVEHFVETSPNASPPTTLARAITPLRRTGNPAPSALPAPSPPRTGLESEAEAATHIPPPSPRRGGLGRGDDAGNEAAYRQRAHELIVKADEAHQRTPETVDRFAWFLLTCEDQSFRNPSKAVELAHSVVKEVPERGDAWLDARAGPLSQRRLECR